MIKYVLSLLFVMFNITNAMDSSIAGQFDPDKDLIFKQDNRTKSSPLTVQPITANQFRDIAINAKLTRVLSIDGGGVRGIGPASWCASLEHITEKPIADMFNLLSGASTGGIIASGLAMEDPNSPGSSLYTADDIVSLYRGECKRIFTRRCLFGYLSISKYQSKPAYSVFNRLYGDTKLSQIRADCDLLIPYYNLTNNRPCFFKTNKARNSALERTEDFYLKDMIASTTAAPTYFKDFKLYTAYNKDHINLFKNTYVSAVDGCIAIDDPNACAMTQAESLYPCSDAFLLVSMGTGQCVSEVWPRGILSWARHISTVLMNNSSDVSEHIFRKFGMYSNRAIFFSRLQFDISEAHISMDNTSPENISYLEHQARTTIPVIRKIRNLGEVLRITDKPKREDISLDTHNAHSMFIEM